MALPAAICMSPYIVIVLPIAAVLLSLAVGLIVRRELTCKPKRNISLRHVQTRPNSTEPLLKDDERPVNYDGYKSTSNSHASVIVSTPPVDDGASYVIQIENLSQEIQSKEKEIERLSVEKEEFSGLLIRDLLAAQKLAEELRKENEFLRKQLAEADAKNPETPPRARKAMDTEEVLKLQQTVQELNGKIKTLELQLRSRSHSPTSQPHLTPAQSRAARSTESPHATPSGTHGMPTLEAYVTETKKRELETTKEPSNRGDPTTPRGINAVSPRDSSSALKWRMERGNKLDVLDKEGYLLIHRAILEDRWDVVKHLLQIGADLNALDSRGETALHLAVRNENELMVDYLLVHEADPNTAGGRDHSTPLHLCAYHGYTKCATALVKAGADVEAKNEDGYTPLRLAIEREQVDFALWLLEKHSVNINCVDNLGETLLTYAVRINKESLIDFLLDSGASADFVDDRNLSPCMVAARADNIHLSVSPSHPLIYSFLPIFPYTSCYLFLRPLLHADLIRMLISRGAVVDSKNSDGKTALHFAASCGSADAAQALLELGADVDARDVHGNTPLHDSCKLVAFHANLNLQGGDGLTPLALAICGNDDDTVALLMSNGAN